MLRSLLCLMSLSLLAAATSGHHRAEGHLSMSAGTTASATVEIPAGVSIVGADDVEGSEQWMRDSSAVQFVTEAHFAAFVLEPHDPDSIQYVAYFSDVLRGKIDGIVANNTPYDDPFDPRVWDIAPGKYTAHLLTDKPASVRLELDGLTDPLILKGAPSADAGYEPGVLRADEAEGAVAAWTSTGTFDQPATMIAVQWTTADQFRVAKSSQFCRYDGAANEDLVWLPGCPTGADSSRDVVVATHGGSLGLAWFYPNRGDPNTVGASWTVLQDGVEEPDDAGLLRIWWTTGP